MSANDKVTRLHMGVSWDKLTIYLLSLVTSKHMHR